MGCLVFSAPDKGLPIRPGVSSFLPVAELYTFVLGACKKRFNTCYQKLPITKRTKRIVEDILPILRISHGQGIPTNSLLNSLSPADVMHHFGQRKCNERNLPHRFTVEQREAHSQVLHDLSFLWSELNSCIC